MIELGAGTLTCEQICRIARNREPVALAAGVVDRLAAGHDAVLRLAAREPVYGRSTGVGALVGVLHNELGTHPAAPPADELDRDVLLRSHATTAGTPVPQEQVRAMTAVRLEQIGVGRSGLGPATAQALVDRINADQMPTVGRYHSLGTGDIAPLARLGLTLPEGALDSGDGLALMSSNAMTIGRSALAVADLDELLAAATVVAALTFLARDASGSALDERATGPFTGPRRAAAALRRLGAGTRPPARLQDQYGLRTAPQTLGLALDAADQLRRVVTALASAGLENPLVVVGPPEMVVHHGGFHAVHLTAALDGAALALARAAVGSVNRLALLMEPAPVPLDRPTPGDLRAFLAGGPVTASGVMVLEYTAAAALGTVRAASVPAAIQTVDLSRGVEQDATYAPLAADQLADALDAARVVIAVELVAATRALRIRELEIPDPMRPAWRACLELPAETRDRDLTEDVQMAERLIARIAPFGRSRDDAPGDLSSPHQEDLR